MLESVNDMKRHRYTEDQDKFIELCDYICTIRATEEFNKMFDLDLSRSSIIQRKKTLLKRHECIHNKDYSEDELEFLSSILDDFKGEIFDWDGCLLMFNTRTGRNINKVRLRDLINKKLHTGVGRTTKSGLHTAPIGHEKLFDNVWYVKVKCDKHKLHKGNYMKKSRYMYEKYHNVKLKDDEYVIHLDCDGDNFDKDNLYLINKNEMCYVKHEWWNITDKELKKLVLADAQLRARLAMED
jgi:hypothetical protein